MERLSFDYEVLIILLRSSVSLIISLHNEIIEVELSVLTAFLSSAILSRISNSMLFTEELDLVGLE